MRLALLILAFLTAPTSAGAQLRDVWAVRDGVHAHVAMEFAVAPTGVAAAPTAAGFAVEMTGVHVQDGVWETAVADVVVTFDVRASDTGALIAVRTADDVLTARAHVIGRAAVIELQLDETAPKRAAVAAPAPAPAPTPPSPPTQHHAARHAELADEAVHTPEAKPDPVERAEPPEPVEAEPEPAPEADEPPLASVSTAARLLLERYAVEADAAACAEADERVRADPWDFEMVGRHGACLALEGRVGEAGEVFTRLLTFSPDDPEPHIGLGVTMAAEGDLTAARLHFEDALNLSRADADAARARMFLDALAEM